MAADASVRLASLYERAGDGLRAAAEYERLGVEDADPERRRQALFRAAELYADAGRSNRARGVYEDYVALYPMPLNLQLEAVNRLLALAEQAGDAAARSRWQQHLIDTALAAGDEASDRLLYLAGEAQLAKALQLQATFAEVRLRHPLADSLALKQRRLNAALEAFEVLASLGVEDYQSAATYHIAQLYADLSQALIDSERPAGLNALELDQYEILLEEEAFPFEELAIELHEVNVQRSWDGAYDDWVAKSFSALGALMPARFAKTELQVDYADSPL
jgi:cellulose synthase operon protein C